MTRHTHTHSHSRGHRHRYSRRHRLLLPSLLLLAPLALTGCGAEKSGEGSGGAGGAPPPGRAELEARARAVQTRVEHVYVTEVEGYRAAQQSAGVLNEDGFQVTYVQRDGGRLITLHVDRGTLDEGTCRTVHPPAESCAKDGTAWYRVTGSRHEYARTENGLRIQVAADRAAVSRAVLRAAAEGAHRADDRELDAVLPEPADPGGRPSDGGRTGTPVERGDLPSHGDGAPQDPPGAGG
ncbi:hypothetical protein [Streptomyces sp. CC224B]|uniref:hypothetical protein n=1 Tax=Streptomyces sp. CC224B TaxID=3044571 RepID=UPI0024A81D44|nr:hypothetical protein [Streptomyces sp. CC224B]